MLGGGGGGDCTDVCVSLSLRLDPSENNYDSRYLQLEWFSSVYACVQEPLSVWIVGAFLSADVLKT